MANREQHSNREKRKPKADKSKAAPPTAAPFASAVMQQLTRPAQPGKKPR